MKSNSLTTKAMLIDLSIRAWSARKFDRKITKEVAQRHGTTEKAGRYNKNLLPEKADSYEAIWAAAGSARIEHYEQTLPWANNGARILPAANYMGYMDKSRAKRRAFDGAVAAFLPEYPALQERAKGILNSMYDPQDWPTPAAMAGRFEFSVKVFPLPSAEDFRVSLQAEEVGTIREQIERDVKESVTAAVGDLWQRLHKAVAHFSEQVKGDGVVREAMLANLRELCEILPRLNLSGDPHLDEMQKQVIDKLGGYDAEDLKKGKRRNRKQAAAEADKIVADLSAFMGS